MKTERFENATSATAASPNSRLALSNLEERQRFFDETRERILQSRFGGHEDLIAGTGNGDLFGQFVRDHQERFAQLTSNILGAPAESATVSASTSEERKQQQPQLRAHQPLSRCTTTGESAIARRKRIEEHLNKTSPSAADVVASILASSDIKQIRKSSSSSRITPSSSSASETGTSGTSGSGPKVRTIEIKREDTTSAISKKIPVTKQVSKVTLNNESKQQQPSPVANNENTVNNSNAGGVVQRSNSGSSGLSYSDSASSSGHSSGFGSLNNNTNQQEVKTPTTTANKTDLHLSSSASKLLDLSANHPVSKLQLLQERRKLIEHHPSFANHFGFAARFGGNPIFGPGGPKRLMGPANSGLGNKMNNMSSSTSNGKMAVTKSKSTLEYTKDNQTYR